MYHYTIVHCFGKVKCEQDTQTPWGRICVLIDTSTCGDRHNMRNIQYQIKCVYPKRFMKWQKEVDTKRRQKEAYKSPVPASLTHSLLVKFRINHLNYRNYLSFVPRFSFVLDELNLSKRNRPMINIHVSTVIHPMTWDMCITYNMWG